MKSPLDRIRRGAMVLLLIVLVSTIGFHLLGPYSWFESLWMVIITISTVGYAEKSTLAVPLQMFTLLVIVFGMSASAYTIGGLIRLTFEGEFDHYLGTRRMNQELAKLSGHIIICGYGRIGQNLADELDPAVHPFVVIDQSSDAFESASHSISGPGISGSGILGQAVSGSGRSPAVRQPYQPISVVGDATTEETLISVGIERAAALVSALPSDAENVFITLTARNLNPDLQIIARAQYPSTEKKLRQAGANRVVMPTVVGARQMARMITRPMTAELMDLVSQSDFEGLELDEIAIREDCQLIGMTVREAGSYRTHNLLIVAVKFPGNGAGEGKMIFNPGAEVEFVLGAVLVLMGHTKDIRQFQSQFNLL